MEYKASKAEYEAYQKAVGKHEKGTNGKPAESIRDMLELLVEQMESWCRSYGKTEGS